MACRFSILFVLFFLHSLVFGQMYEDAVYDPNIATVTFNLRNRPMSMPIANLDAGQGVLHLGFDELIGDISDFAYTIIHCDQDWKPSDLRPDEYLKGFQDGRITTTYAGFNTLVNYNHYDLFLPNNQIQWTKSGNYILKVYDEYDPERIILTRRFMVVEPNWLIEGKWVPSANTQKRNSHQEIDFTITTTDTRVSDPRNEIRAFIFQNGNWTTTIGPIQPFFIRGDQAIFDYQDSISFPALKEYRFFDIRTLEVRGNNVKEVQRTVEGWDAFVQVDESRANQPYTFIADADGNFLIDCRDRNISMETITLQGSQGDSLVHQQRSNLYRQEDIEQCDYALVFFTFKSKQPFQDDDLYLLGKFTDWRVLPLYKMEYDEATGYYFGEAFLKQGYYNYQYVLVDKETGKIDPISLEGSWYETNNSYTILAYFRPFGARYDRLMGARTITADVQGN